MKTNFYNASKWILVIATLGLWAYDIFPVLSEPSGDTLSEVIRDYAGSLWFFPLMMGTLMGHWFWLHDTMTNYWLRLKIFGVVMLLSAIANVITYNQGMELTPHWVMLIGIPLGHFLFPLEKKKD